MWRRLSIAVLVAGLALAMAGPAQAIVYGEFDGDLHPNVGTLIADWNEPFGQLDENDIFCSGALIAQDVFLTASHCTVALVARGIPRDEVFVSFDPVITKDSKFLPGTSFTNPEYGGGQNDTGDVAVIVLDDPVRGLTPAQLPTKGLLDELKADHELDDQTFTAVGYGTVREQRQGGFDEILENDERRFALQHSLSLTNAWLTLSMNEARGDGGTCYGDSGGPHFLGGVESTLIVSITVTGDAVCKATDKTYRMDIDSARDFLEEFVPLP
jgi:secreted trypsin-like serine protease